MSKFVSLDRLALFKENLLEKIPINTNTSTYYLLATTTDNKTYYNENITINPAEGSITASKVYNAVWNDYAEWFEKENISDEFEPGDICIWYDKGVLKSFQENDRTVVGVVSDTYGHIIGGVNMEDMELNNKKFVPIGLKGRVKCKVTGIVKTGDLIVTSNIRGVGKVDNDARINCVIGKALTNSEEEGIKKIQILI